MKNTLIKKLVSLIDDYEEKKYAREVRRGDQYPETPRDKGCRDRKLYEEVKRELRFWEGLVSSSEKVSVDALIAYLVHKGVI